MHHPDHVEHQYYVRTADGEHVRVHFETDVGLIQPEEHLTLGGHWNNEKSLEAPSFTATTVLKHLGVAAAGDPGARSPLVHRVAVILLGTPGFTKEQVWSQVNPTAGSAAAYIAESSNGMDTLQGDVFGPYDVDTSNCGERIYQISDLAKAAVAKEGKSLDGYTNIAFLLPPGAGCPWGGAGHVGTPGSTEPVLSWYNNWFDCKVVAHELGHNLGLLHGHLTTCPGALYTPGRGGCTDVEYGHPYDVMGSGSCGRDGHYSTPQKQYMGWLGPCEDVTAGGSAVFDLSPMEGNCGLRSLRIPIAGETSYYYLEYRKQSAGQFAGARGEDRVVLAVSNDGATVRPDHYFLDSTPNVGTTYNLPGSVQIKVLGLGDAARVQVTMPAGQGAVCRSGERPPADSFGNIGGRCTDGCPTDPNKTSPGYCGCGVPDVDTDGDGARDCTDACPADSNKVEPGQCGCGALELTCAGQSPGLIRKHYTGRWYTLPDFAQLKADEEKVVSTVDLNDYPGAQGFGLVFTGGIRIDQAGTYDFELSSDDGSRLRIDDREIISNDGPHGFLTKRGSVELSAGTHAIRVEYFQQGGDEGLALRYRASGGTYVDLSGSILVHASDECPNDPNKTTPGVCGCGKTEDSCSGNAQCVQTNEFASAALACPSGQTITQINFASYGTPTGACGSFAPSSCHASNSTSVVEQACIGLASCSVSASNGVFGDPCYGTFKRLAVEYVCAP